MHFTLLFLSILVFCTRHSRALGVCPTSTYAPIPSNEISTVNPSIGYRIQSLGDGAYMVTDGIYQAQFYVSTESVIVVDAPPTIGHNILNAIRGVTSLPISHVVYSHAHADHIGGAYLLSSAGDNITFVAHRLTLEELQQTPDTKHRPYPTVTFETSHKLCVGNQTLELSYRGPNHEPGNIFIYAPQQKVLMLVDIVFPGWVPFDALGEVQNVPGYINAHDQVLEFDFDYFVGGHLDRIGTRKDVITQKEYVHDLFKCCAHALELSANPSGRLSAATILPPVEKANPGNPWAEFRSYLDTLAGYCANKSIETWVGRLAGADVYAASNANIMLEAVRIDYGYLGPFGVTN